VASGKRRIMGYENAGTVEIIIDMLFSDFDFVEMNTQLQVIISSYLIFF
jgi:acetyl/propionyl-CoA carboxylase alpha subunit